MSVESMWLRAHAPFQISFTHSAFLKGQGSNQFNSIQIYSQNGTRCTFRIFFFGGGVASPVPWGWRDCYGKTEILAGWVTKICLKGTKKLG